MTVTRLCAGRAELYKNYLMYSMSGDVVELPVGGVIRKKTNLQARQAEMQRLSQLGDILGMSQAEIGAVHQDLAEQAFRAQVRLYVQSGGAYLGGGVGIGVCRRWYDRGMQLQSSHSSVTCQNRSRSGTVLFARKCSLN